MLLSSNILTKFFSLAIIALLLWAGFHELNISFQRYRALSYVLVGIALLTSSMILVICQFTYGKLTAFSHVFLASLLIIIGLLKSSELSQLTPNTLSLALVTCLLPVTLVIISFTRKLRLSPVFSAVYSLCVLILGMTIFLSQTSTNFLGINHEYNAGLSLLGCTLYTVAFFKLKRPEFATEDAVIQVSRLFSLLFLIATALPLLIGERSNLLNLVTSGLFSLFTLGLFAAQIRHNFIVPYHKTLVQLEKSETSRNLLRTIIDHVPMGLFWKNKKSIFMGANKSFLNDVGFNSENDLIGKSESEIHPDKAAFFIAQDQKVMNSGQAEIDVEEWYEMEGGHSFWMRRSKVPLFDDYRRSIGILGLYTDVTETREAQELIKQQANYDLITGLPNRRMILDRLEQLILQSNRRNTCIAVLLLDLDYFKEVNDTLGHDKGDLLLKQVGKRIQNLIRQSDTVARLGGDEFVLILPDITQMTAIERIATAIIAELSIPFQFDNDQITISTSIGITVFPQDGSQVTQLLKNADQAMYQAKHLGRGQFQYFTPEMHDALLQRTYMINALRDAISKQELTLYYQPIVDLNTNQFKKAEALIRWIRPGSGLVNPADFIPLAEETRQIIEIGDWVMQEAARQVAIWQKTIDPEFQISVNTSPVQYENNDNFLSPEFLKSHIPDSKSICIEITESLLMESSSDVSNKLLALREAGIDVSLDDFGTGYSSLAYLNKFSIDYLKIDQSFVHGITENNDNRILCETIIEMAHRLNIKVVAEGIETDEQRIILKNAGCDFGQGYFFSKPVPADELGKISI